MPCRGFWCPIERRRVSAEHFVKECQALERTVDRRTVRMPAVPAWLASAMWHAVTEDVRHGGLELTATRTQSCPRAALIQLTQDWWIDPTRRWASARGSLLHKVAGGWTDPKEWITETYDPVWATVEGYLWPSLVESLGEDGKLVTAAGVRVSGRFDALKRDMSVLMDHKFPLDGSARFRSKDPRLSRGQARLEHAVQLNIERLLLGQQQWALDLGYDPDRVTLVVADYSVGSTEGPTCFVAEHLTEEEMLEIRPGSTAEREAQYTIGEIVCLWIQVRRAYEELLATGPTAAAIEYLCAQVPCVGESQYGGTGCDRYCDVSRESAALMRRYGRPEEIVDGQSVEEEAEQQGVAWQGDE